MNGALNCPRPSIRFHDFSQYPTSIVSDALDELGIQGVMPGIDAVTSWDEI